MAMPKSYIGLRRNDTVKTTNPQRLTNAVSGEVKLYFRLTVTRAGSEGRRNTCAQFIRWSLEAQSFSRALIETQGDLVQLGLRQLACFALFLG
jgi:hypothetical protein